jgi:hypothetical protein
LQFTRPRNWTLTGIVAARVAVGVGSGVEVDDGGGCGAAHPARSDPRIAIDAARRAPTTAQPVRRTVASIRP